MKCKSFNFTRHAIEQMFSRKISDDEVKNTIRKGEIIQSYPGDNPYPSYLIFHYIKERPLHTVVAVNNDLKECIVVTVYEPSLQVWKDDFKTRR